MTIHEARKEYAREMSEWTGLPVEQIEDEAKKWEKDILKAFRGKGSRKAKKVGKILGT